MREVSRALGSKASSSCNVSLFQMLLLVPGPTSTTRNVAQLVVGCWQVASSPRSGNIARSQCSPAGGLEGWPNVHEQTSTHRGVLIA